MGIDPARFAALVKAAEERGPVEMSEDEEADFAAEQWEYDEFGRPKREEFPKLAPLSPEVLLEANTEEKRAALASQNAGLDVESYLTQPGRRVPRLVVTGYQAANGKQAIVTGSEEDLLVHVRAFLAFTGVILGVHEGALVKKDTENVIGNLLVNQDIAFDLCVIAEEAHRCDVILGLVGHPDSWFDIVMRRIFDLLDRGLVEDTHLRERLIDLAEGTLGYDFDNRTEKGNPRLKGYNLKALGKRYLGFELDKSMWRTGYSRYLNKSVEEMPKGAIKYLTDDVETALAVATQQQRRAELHGLPPGARIPNSAEQSKAAFALNLVSAWGLRTDLAKVQQLDADLDKASRSLLRVLQEHGLVRTQGRDAGTRDMKRIHALVQQMYEEKGLKVPRTKTGRISTAGSVLEDIALIALRGHARDIVNEQTGQIDEEELFKQPLYALSQYTSIKNTLQGTFLPVLYAGTKYPINTTFEVILETGRISSFKPNINNLPRGGIKTLLQRLQSRVRQCFVPRQGFVYCSTDYSAIELCALAQVLLWFFGSSKMADAINAGLDLHVLFAAEQLLHIPYEEAAARVKASKGKNATPADKHAADMRQLSKVANFGLGGGMGAASFVEFAKASYNVYVTEDEARVLKEKWLSTFPEMRSYFRRISAMMRGVDEFGQSIGDIEQFVSGRIRGRARYCAACNSFFQGLSADGAKAALYALMKECYLRSGRMYGARVVVFLYDEFITELPEHKAHEYAMVQSEVAEREMQNTVPDVKISAPPALMRCWYKEADTVKDANGILIPWEPKVAA